MGNIAPGQYIDPSPTEALRFGLFSVANMPDANGRWNLGVEWEPLAGERADLRASECVDDYNTQLELREGEETLEGVPFVVAGSYGCLSASRPLEEAEERATLHLLAGEERAVERAIVTGEVANEPTLGNGQLLGVPGIAYPLATAVAMLESALAEQQGSVGTIHSPRFLAPFFTRDAIVDRRGEHIETLVGTYVAFGAGYDGPAKESATEYWLYGSGRPTIRRGEVFVQPDETKYLDRSSNWVSVMAQREYIVYWDYEPFRVLVDVEES